MISYRCVKPRTPDWTGSIQALEVRLRQAVTTVLMELGSAYAINNMPSRLDPGPAARRHWWCG